jgi:hypothetical protein
MGDMAELTLEWAWEEDEPRSRPTKKQLMRLIKSHRWHRRKLVRLQRFTDEDFYIAIGPQTLRWVWYELERRRQEKPARFGRRSHQQR